MRKYFFIVYCIVLTLFFIQGCGKIPSTKELDDDIKILNTQLEKAVKESNQYAGGLIKTLIDLRIQILNNSKAMLEQKKRGLNRFVRIKYTVDGKIYKRSADYEKEIEGITKEIEEISAKIEEIQDESDRYTGGLIKAMLESNIATTKNTIAFLEQKKLSLKYEIPIYLAPSFTEREEIESTRKPMEGSDLDNL